jgi:heptosyltransferase I
VDAYGDPGEDYPLSMETRLDRMPRITVGDVMAKVERWKARYASPSRTP